MFVGIDTEARVSVTGRPTIRCRWGGIASFSTSLVQRWLRVTAAPPELDRYALTLRQR